MSLIFNRGCSGHHYERIETDNFKIKETGSREEVGIFRKVKDFCKHEGCTKEREYYRKERERVPAYDVERVLLNPSKLKQKGKKYLAYEIIEDIEHGEFENLEELKKKLGKRAEEWN